MASAVAAWKPPPAAAAAVVDVSVCIVNWNCLGLLRNCLRSLFDQPQGVAFEVVVVDNGSCDGAPEMVAAEFPQVTLVCNAENRGYATACNQAAARSRGRFLLFLNNDTVVPAGTLRRLVAHAERDPSAGLFGPRLRDPAGRLQVSYRRRPTLAALLHKLALVRWTGLFRQAYSDYRRGAFDPAATEPHPVDVLLGPALFLSRAVFEEVGGWDEHYRFGVEDIDLSVRIARSCRRVVYLPDVEVIHHGRASSRLNVGYVTPGVMTGYVRFLRKSGSGRGAVFTYKLAVTLDAPVQLVVKTVEAMMRRLTGRRRAAARSWAAARGVAAFLTRELPRFWRV